MLENQYLLCLAMLNFDHPVTLVFMGNSYQKIMNDESSRQKWRALKMYGVENFYCLDPVEGTLSDGCAQPLSVTDFLRLKSQADFIS